MIPLPTYSILQKLLIQQKHLDTIVLSQELHQKEILRHMMPTVQNHQEPVVGCHGFSSEWFAHMARTTSVHHIDNNTKEKSHVNSQLYRSHSIATSRFRELLLLILSLLERLWYNYQYIYNVNNQFYHLIGITNNKSSDIQPL